MKLYKLEIEYDRTYFTHCKIYVSTSKEKLSEIVKRILGKFPNAYHQISEYEIGEEPVQIFNISNSIDD